MLDVVEQQLIIKKVSYSQVQTSDKWKEEPE